jgi:hypothetical protein
MIKPIYKATLAAGVVAALSACGGGETPEDTSFVAQNLLWSADSSGYVNVFADDGANRFTHVNSFQPKNALGQPLVIGELHFNAGKAFIVIQSGLVDTKDTTDTSDDVKTGGGVAVYDLATQKFEGTVSLVSNETGNESRIVHTYKDPNGNYLWLNNDGPRALTKPEAPAADASQTVKDKYDADLAAYNASAAKAAEDDSVFRLNWNPADAEGDDKFLSVVEIKTGNGHKKGAHSYKSVVAGQAEALPFYGVHNGDESLSIVGNDPDNTDSYLKVISKTEPVDPLRTWSMKSSREITNSDGTKRLAKNGAHGMAYSPFSGKFYVGITAGEDLGMAIVDAKTMDLTFSSIPAGDDATAGQIPAGGYVKVSHDGKFVYTIGSKTITVDGAQEKHSFLSIIGAEPNGSDTVKQVIDLGEMTASSFNIAEYDHDGHTEVKLFIPSSAGGHHKNVVKVIELDHETGVQKLDTAIETINVGMAQDHRNGFAHEGHRFAYYPNGGDCSATPAATTGGHTAHMTKVSARHAGERHDCRTVSVIDIETNKEVHMFSTMGDKPGSLNVADVKDLNIRVQQHEDDMH